MKKIIQILKFFSFVRYTADEVRDKQVLLAELKLLQAQDLKAYAESLILYSQKQLEIYTLPE